MPPASQRLVATASARGSVAATPGTAAHRAAATEAAKEAPKAPRRPKNFVRDEDFEFEFLDLDDTGKKWPFF